MLVTILDNTILVYNNTIIQYSFAVVVFNFENILFQKLFNFGSWLLFPLASRYMVTIKSGPKFRKMLGTTAFVNTWNTITGGCPGMLIWAYWIFDTSTGFSCNICGILPKIVVCDATSLGFQKKFSDIAFPKPPIIKQSRVKRQS